MRSSAFFTHDESRSPLCNDCNSRVHPGNAPAPAQPISPPVEAADDLYYSSRYVDFEPRVYQIYWTDTPHYPNLSNFPVIDGTIRSVTLSERMAMAVAPSALINYGTDGCVRCSHLDPLPIVKISHPNNKSRLRIQHEYKILKEMKSRSLSVPSFAKEPLIDEEGIFGYRMELLFPIDLYDLEAVSEELGAIIDRVHGCGLPHGDLNPSNIMRNASGDIVLIDPSFAGPLGQEIPDDISLQHEGNVFCTTTDEKHMAMFFHRDSNDR